MDLYDDFIDGFCKVQFLCYEAEPNWLGWIVLGFGALVVALIALGIVAAIQESL